MDWVMFFLAGWGAGFSAYAVLQAITLWALKRPVWYLALLPLGPMGYVAMLTSVAYARSSNLWPIVMIFASPIAVLYLLAVGVIGLRVQEHPRKRNLVWAMIGISLIACIPYVFIFAASIAGGW